MKFEEAVATKYNGNIKLADRKEVSSSYIWDFMGHDEDANGNPVDIFMNRNTAEKVAVKGFRGI